MSMQDPLADMLTTIRNAQAVGIKEVRSPFSMLKQHVLRVMKEEGYIESYKLVSSDNKNDLDISLKYYEGRPVIEKIKRVSRPSLRVYRGYNDLSSFMGGMSGVTILSTSNGVMSGKSAQAQKVGGEILCTVE